MKYAILLLILLISAFSSFALFPDAQIYVPFDGDFNNYGTVGYGEQAKVVAAGKTVPEIGPGIVRGAFDMRSAESSFIPGGLAAFGDLSKEIQTPVEASLDGAFSFSVAFWVIADSDFIPDPEAEPASLNSLAVAHIIDRDAGGNMEVFCNYNGVPRLRVAGVWIGVPVPEETMNVNPDTEHWTFYTYTYDGSPGLFDSPDKVHLYVAHHEDGYQLNEVPLSPTYSVNYAGPVPASGPLLVGNRYLYHGARQCTDGMIDELRIWAENDPAHMEDGTAVLTIDQIQAVVDNDLAASGVGQCGDWNHQYKSADFDENCIINIIDFADFASDWLASE
jgi:hypothetical protein